MSYPRLLLLPGGVSRFADKAQSLFGAQALYVYARSVSKDQRATGALMPLKEGLYQEIVARIAKKGFDVSQLVKTVQAINN